MTLTTGAASATDRPLRAATRAVYAAFIWAGVAMASWATRIPQVRDELRLDPSQLGLVLVAIAAGSIISLVLSGHIVARFGSRATVAAMAVLLTVSLIIVAGGYHLGVPPVVLGLFGFGFANGAWDVAMNVQGALVERRLGRAIMPRFHAGYSVGTVAGALLGTAMVALKVPVTIHLITVAIIVGASTFVMVRAFLPDTPDTPAADAADAGKSGGTRRFLEFWTEPRTLLIGVFVLAFAFTEGAGIDWIAVAVIDGYRTPAAVGTLAFTVFLTAMTLGRWFGPGLLDRFGRVPVLRALAVIALAGLLLFIFGPNTPTAFVGALLWGTGASLGFPVGMSAASDDPAKAAGRVSVVASIGYCAFLGGPPLIGLLGDHVSVLKALIAIAVLLTVAFMLAGAIRPLPVPEEAKD
ncbi:MFS transporter [Dactylosporangium aurantiacum]|uniref:MFS transporter n=1 Tax=Dactylosporangium aurantiacum TaxID=35754 RepID=A0A9Q9IL93_9ACTN|nr:MFS transporter [Dactylosporangium aurantiacum]MDG6100848.1 MFS transporter [Dactylosporangium aurantiacum]UWZ55093.1 MFS transporter [Dactylosporangium aurantiacum]